MSIYASASATSTGFSTTNTLTGTHVLYAQVPITAGASKMANLGTCTETANAAVATGRSEVYKVLIVPGAAALLAGAFV